MKEATGSQRKNTIAVCAFVKTPGYSAVKTRLARSIGRDEAESLYLACISDTESLLRKISECLPDSRPYWAVAEAEALAEDRWKSFPVVSQSEGTLGDRLATVCAAMAKRHEYIILLGADAPYISLSLISNAVKLLRECRGRAVIGPAEDGGFYLAGVDAHLPPVLWRSVSYSKATTAAELTARLEKYVKVYFLEAGFDIDDRESLEKAKNLCVNGGFPLHCTALRHWFAQRAAVSVYGSSMPSLE